MKPISIITGGAGGMGLATAKCMGRDHHVLLSDVNAQRLDAAVSELRRDGVTCDATVCDITQRSSVDALFQQAAALGTVSSVIHTAGLSPQMAKPEVILRVNAVGTIYVTEAALRLAREGFALINVASMAGHMVPSWLLPTGGYPRSFTDPEAFFRKTFFPLRFLPKGLAQTGMAYSVSKHFVIWYSKKNAARFGEKGARVLSVSPGSFETEMGRLEEKSGSAKMLETAALKRFGKPEEIAELLAFCASAKCGYLTGTDILCDGGVIAGRS